MANPPRHHPVATNAKNTGGDASAPAKRPPGRPRKAPPAPDDAGNISMPTARQDENSALPPMTEAACIESARVHHEEERLRKDRAEVLRREKALWEKEEAQERRKRGAAAANSVIAVVEHPKRHVKAALDPLGRPIVRMVKGMRGELRGGREEGASADLDAAQHAADKEMVQKLRVRKRKAGNAAPGKTQAMKKTRK